MSLEEYEGIIFGIISTAGNAKSICYEGLRAAKQGDFITSKQKIEEADKVLAGLHAHQMELIQKEAKGGKNEFSVLLVHALDIMMDSLAVRDMANELIELYMKLDSMNIKKT